MNMPLPLPETLAAAFSDGNCGEDVTAFCSRHELAGELDEALRLAQVWFPGIEALTVSVREDYENEDVWLSLKITVRAGVEEALQSYERFVQAWVETVPWPKRGLIRLSYSAV
jgi:hypothetical protein